MARSAVQLVAAVILACGAGAALAEEATPKPATRRAPKTFRPRLVKEDVEKRIEKQNRALKRLGRKNQRATPSLSTFEGPRSLEEEKAATRAFPGTRLDLQGAVVGRREMARIDGFRDHDFGGVGPWTSIGPLEALYPVETSRTNKPYVTSGRITALALDPRCNTKKSDGDEEDRSCRLLVGAAGGGIWRTDRPFSNTPRWEFTSGNFATNAIGTIAFDPRRSNVVWVGTGEPNASADSAAGLGLYRSTDGGENWKRVSSTLTFAGPSGPITLADGFNDLSISSIAFDPGDSRTFYVATTLGIRGISATVGAVIANNMAPPSLYKTTDGGATFREIWNGGGDVCKPFGDPCLSSWGIDKVELDPADPRVIYAAAVDVGIWRSSPSENGGAFTQVFFSQNQANIGSDRTDFTLAALANGKLRIYAANGATGAFTGFPPPETSYSQVWRTDDARRPAAVLIAEEAQVLPGNLPPAPGGWKKLTSNVVTDPGYATFDFCTGQCWYDMGIYSPAGRPDTVFVLGSYTYGEAYGISNARAVLRSTTAGDPDPANNNVTFTDLTFDGQTPNLDATYLTNTTAIHPDQHALVFVPGNPDLWFEGSDGGLVRSSGKYTSISSTCSARLRPVPASRRITCERLLSAVPTQLFSLNFGLVTLQFQHLSINPNKPFGELQGGTQDNGTLQYEGSRVRWLQSIGGDGGLSGFDASNPVNRFHTFFGPQVDVNLAGGDPLQWFWISDPLVNSNENARFYIPIIGDPRPERGGTMFAGLQWIWRTTDNGGDPAFLAANCNESGPFTDSNKCGDWKHLGNRRLTGGTVSWISRSSGNTGTLWAGTASGRVYIFTNADAADPATAGQFEVSDALAVKNTTPVRFISGIAIDPANPNHGWVSYGGYNSVAPSTQTAVPGHVFEVTWDGVSPRATFTPLDGTGPGSLGDLPLNSLVRDDVTGDLYVANDFGVLRRDAKTGHWHTAAEGMPMVEVSSLAIDSAHRVIYAATHGRGAYRALISKTKHDDDDDDDKMADSRR